MKLSFITLASIALLAASCGKKNTDNSVAPSSVGTSMEGVDLSQDFDTIMGTEVAVAGQQFSLDAPMVDPVTMPVDKAELEKDAAIIKEKHDADKDGVMDSAEVGAAREAFEKAKAEWMKKLDTDGDGKISKDEIQAAVKALHERIKAMRQELLLKIFDKNKDGKLDDSEYMDLKTIRAMHMKSSHSHIRGRFAEFDTNKDGMLSADEIKVMGETLKSECEKKHKERIKEIDTNGDGKISAEEIQAHHKSKHKDKDHMPKPPMPPVIAVPPTEPAMLPPVPATPK